jgi:hypothetical protein
VTTLRRWTGLGYDIDVRVFLSYARADEKWARQIAALLTNSGLRVWDPEREVLPGDDLAAKLGKALRDSDAMVVLLSPEALESRWVRNEIESALGSERFRDRLVSVVLRPTKGIPWILQQLPHVRVTKDIGSVGEEILALLKKGELTTTSARAAR